MLHQELIFFSDIVMPYCHGSKVRHFWQVPQISKLQTKPNMYCYMFSNSLMELFDGLIFGPLSILFYPGSMQDGQ